MELTRRTLTHPTKGDVAVYTGADAAKALGRTTKTLVAWTKPGDGIRPELEAWPPKSEHNPSRNWLFDAEQIDDLCSHSTGPTRSALAAEQERLADERAIVEIDRAMVEQERSEALQAEVARLRGRVTTLETQNEELGRVIASLTQRSTVQ